MIKRIEKHRGVIGVMLFNNDGVAIKSNLNEGQTNLWAVLVADVIKKARVVGRTVSDGSSMAMVRIRSTKHEVMITPEEDYFLVSIHQQENEN